jgi:hypothetical protein
MRRRGRSRHVARLKAALLVLAFCCAAVAAARADSSPGPGTVFDQLKQMQDVGPYSCTTPAGQQGCVGTEATPIAKPSALWSQVAGAVFPAAADGSMDPAASLKVVGDAGGNAVVPADVDFFVVASKDPTEAYAGGSECQDPVPANDTKAGDVIAYVRSCTRVPVIYRYTRPSPDQPGAWSLDYRGSNPGYVGGLGYTTSGLVVAVGGSGLSSDDAEAFGPQIYAPENGVGAYPYREDCNPATSPITSAISGRPCTVDLNAREAGGGRVWVKGQAGSSSWCEAYTPGGCTGSLSCSVVRSQIVEPAACFTSRGERPVARRVR